MIAQSFSNAAEELVSHSNEEPVLHKNYTYSIFAVITEFISSLPYEKITDFEIFCVVTGKEL
jgi:hypothetical protein